ncbi:MAG TPA: methyl-accepting chemotaxis protein [Thermaerobacter sp.]
MRGFRFTVGTKMQLVFCGVLLMMGTITYGGIVAINDLARTSDELDRIGQSLALTERVQFLAEQQVSAVYGFLLTGDPAYRNLSEEAARGLGSALADLRGQVVSGEGRAMVDAVAAAVNGYQQAVAPTIAIRVTDSQEIRQALQRLQGPQQELDGALAQLAGNRARRAEEIRAQQAAVRRRAYLLMGVPSAVVAIAGLLISLSFTRGITRALRQVATTARRVADGDLTVPFLDVRSRDEVGDMARAFNDMLRGLRQLLDAVGQSTRSVLDAARELTDASQQSAAGAAEAAQAVSQVAAGVTEQAQASEEVRQTIEQLRQTTEQIAAGAQQTAGEIQATSELLDRMNQAVEAVAGNAERARGRAEEAGATADRGAEVVRQTLDVMEEIRRAVGASAERIRSLEELSSQIGEITQVISGIAEQTNLLALNAAIEAARAGEHGRGFAVVADEVRKLAERSAVSAREITGLIERIQSGTAEVVKAMETATAEVDRGGIMANQTGEALQQILASVRGVVEDVRAIFDAAHELRASTEQVVRAFDAVAAVTEENTAATEEMAAGASQVGQSVERVAAVAQENAAAAEQVSAAIEQLKNAAGRVAESAGGLTRVAGQLQEQVARFRLATAAAEGAD